MSAVSADVLLRREAVDENLDPRLTASKYSLAMDAVTKGKSHAGQSVKAYLDVLLDVLKNFPVVQSRDGVFDARILTTIDASKGFINEYRNLIVTVAELDNVEEMTPHLSAFLEGVLTLKKTYQLSDNAAYLWRDALGFISREIFVSTVAALLAHCHWKQVRKLIEHKYSVQGSQNAFGFYAFDGFQRSLDVFRNRRLKLQRLSVTADLLKQRVEDSALGFTFVMQADLVLHLYSLVTNNSPMQMWYARTLGFADEQLLTGFDLFVDIRAGKGLDSLTTLFPVADWAQLRNTIDAAVAASGLNGPDGLDYMGFIAANNGLFDD